MRLKEDANSWRAKNLKNKELPITDTPIKGGKKKNTGKWCKGKVGKLHEWEVKIPQKDSGYVYGFRRFPICKNCGKYDYSKVEYKCDKCGNWTGWLKKGGWSCGCSSI